MRTRRRARVVTDRTLACPECGTPTDGYRFCGHCGARARDTSDADPAPAAVPETADATVAERPQRRRRWLLAGTALVAAVVATMVLSEDTEPEVVTVPGDRSNSGVTSSLTPGSLDTEHWRVPVAAGDARFPGSPHLGEITADAVIVHPRAGPPQRVDRTTGEVTPVDVDAETTRIIEAGRVVEIGPDGAVRVLSAVDQGTETPTHVPIHLRRMGDLDVGWEVTEVAVFDGERHWVHRDREWIEGVVLADDETLVLASAAGLTALDARSGQERWTLPRDPEQASYPLRATAGLLLVVDSGALAAVDVETGEVVWRVDAPATEWVWNDDERAIARGGLPLGRTAVVVVALDDGRVLHRDDETFRIGERTPLETRSGVVLPVFDGVGAVGLLRPDGSVGWVVEPEDDPGATVEVRADPATGGAVEARGYPDGRMVVETLPGRERIVDVTLVSDDRPTAWVATPMAVTLGAVAVTPNGDGSTPRPGSTLRDLATGTVTGTLPAHRSWPVYATGAGFLSIDDTGGAAGPTLRDRDGNVVWTVETSGGWHEVVLATADRVLTHEDDGDADPGVTVLRDAASGEPIGAPLDGRVHPFSATLAPDGSVLVAAESVPDPSDEVGAGSGFQLELASLDLTDAGPRPRWRKPSPYAVPLADDRRVVVVGQTYVQVLSPATGEVVDQHDLVRARRDPWSDTPVLADGRLVVPRRGELTVYDVDSGEVVWSDVLPADTSSEVIVAGDEVLVGLVDGTVARRGLHDGADRGVVPIGDTPVLEVVVVHGILLARDHDWLVMRGPAELPRQLVDATLGDPERPPAGQVRVPAP